MVFFISSFLSFLLYMGCRVCEWRFRQGNRIKKPETSVPGRNDAAGTKSAEHRTIRYSAQRDPRGSLSLRWSRVPLFTMCLTRSRRPARTVTCSWGIIPSMCKLNCREKRRYAVVRVRKYKKRLFRRSGPDAVCISGTYPWLGRRVLFPVPAETNFHSHVSGLSRIRASQ